MPNNMESVNYRMKWKEKNKNVYSLDLANLEVCLHRRYNKDRWFMTVSHPPMRYNNHPLQQIDLQGAQKESVQILFDTAVKVRNDLQSQLNSDSKTINSVKMRLMKIREMVSDVEHNFPGKDLIHFEALIDELDEFIFEIL